MAIRLKEQETPLGERSYESNGRWYCCPQCDSSFSEDDFEDIDVVYSPNIAGEHYGPNRNGDDSNLACAHCTGDMLYIYADSGRAETAWACGDGCFNHDSRPNMQDGEETESEYEGSGEIWCCGKCKETYWQAHHQGDADDAKQEAVQCCQ